MAFARVANSDAMESDVAIFIATDACDGLLWTSVKEQCVCTVVVSTYTWISTDYVETS
jgi:hypothetical protein